MEKILGYDLGTNSIGWAIVDASFDAEYYLKSPSENPHGPAQSSSYVVRDGSWAFESYKLRVSYRHWGFPTHKFSNYGFRCARTP